MINTVFSPVTETIMFAVRGRIATDHLARVVLRDVSARRVFAVVILVARLGELVPGRLTKTLDADMGIFALPVAVALPAYFDVEAVVYLIHIREEAIYPAAFERTLDIVRTVSAPVGAVVVLVAGAAGLLRPNPAPAVHADPVWMAFVAVFVALA